MDKVESGFSEGDNSDKEFRKSKKSGLSEDIEDNLAKKPKILFAALRLYLDKQEVQYVSIENILKFDENRKDFPYSALVANGLDENGSVKYEPGEILAVSDSKDELKARKTRWKKLQMTRRSEVLRELAESMKYLTKKPQPSKKTRGRKRREDTTINPSKLSKQKPVLPLPFDGAQDKMKKQINILNTVPLDFDQQSKTVKESDKLAVEIEEKNKLIANLMQQLKEARGNPNSAHNPHVANSSLDVIGDNVSSSFESRVTSVIGKGTCFETPSTNLHFTSNTSPGISTVSNTPSLTSEFANTARMLNSRRNIVMTESSSDTESNQLRRSPRINTVNFTPSIFQRQIQRSKESSFDKTDAISPRTSNRINRVNFSPSLIGRQKQRSKVPSSFDKSDSRSPRTPIQINRVNFSPSIIKRQSQRSKVPSPLDKTYTRSPRTPTSILNRVSPAKSLLHEEAENPKKKKNESHCKRTGKNQLNTEKPKKKYIKKRKECFYDSDDYAKSDKVKIPPLTKITEEYKNKETGLMEKKSKFHLHFGISVAVSAWRQALKAKSSSAFLRQLVLHIWKEEIFVTLAVDITKVIDRTGRVSIQEAFPIEFEALKRGYVQFLQEQGVLPTEKKKRKLRIAKYGRELGIIISEERRKYFTPTTETPLDSNDPLNTDDEVQHREKGEGEGDSDEYSSEEN